MAVLAAILMVVAYNMGEWREIPELLKLTMDRQSASGCATFALTVFADLTVAVEAGMILAALLFIRRVVETTTVSRVTRGLRRSGRVHIAPGQGDPGLRRDLPHPRAVPVRRDRQARGLSTQADELPPIVDPAPAQHDGDRRDRPARDSRTSPTRCAPPGRDAAPLRRPPQPAQLMDQAEFHRHVGDANVCANVQAALERARVIYETRGRGRGRRRGPFARPARLVTL